MIFTYNLYLIYDTTTYIGYFFFKYGNYHFYLCTINFGFVNKKDTLHLFLVLPVKGMVLYLVALRNDVLDEFLYSYTFPYTNLLPNNKILDLCNLNNTVLQIEIFLVFIIVSVLTTERGLLTVLYSMLQTF